MALSANAQAHQFITKLSESYQVEALREDFRQMKEFHEKKLWHQLTLKLESLLKNPNFVDGVPLYENFIKEFESKMNQFRFAKIILVIAKQISAVAERVNFLEKLAQKINSEDEKQAYTLFLTELAYLKLQLGLLEDCKQLVDKVATIHESVTGIDPLVHSSYFRALLEYYKKKVMPTEFYKNALMYLVYTPLENIPLSEQQSLAFDMGLAALVSTDIHNFGELLAHPVLEALKGSKGEWLREFLFAFNSGNLDKFDTLMNTYRAQFQEQVVLRDNQVLLWEKLRILALMELVLNKTSDQRTLPFSSIAQFTKIRQDEVELLVMRALSLKLIKGVIDEVSQTVTISWVQPRVLDLQQVGKMKDRVGEWIEDVNSVVNYMQNQTSPELLT